jgi:hypothetical protein
VKQHDAWRSIRATLASAALAGVLIGAIGCGGKAKTMVTLEPTEHAEGASGRAIVIRLDSGWQIVLDATGLPRLDGTGFYQAWLGNGESRVSIGTFNEPDRLTLSAGVSPEEFPELTVTRMELTRRSPASLPEPVLKGEIGLSLQG